MRTPAYIRKVKKGSKCGGITFSYSENPGTGWVWVWCHLVFKNGSLICNVTQSLEGNRCFSVMLWGKRSLRHVLTFYCMGVPKDLEWSEYVYTMHILIKSMSISLYMSLEFTYGDVHTDIRMLSFPNWGETRISYRDKIFWSAHKNVSRNHTYSISPWVHLVICPMFLV